MGYKLTEFAKRQGDSSSLDKPLVVTSLKIMAIILLKFSKSSGINENVVKALSRLLSRYSSM
jgi:hypothetical protein